jgi:hypothetical protein
VRYSTTVPGLHQPHPESFPILLAKLTTKVIFYRVNI